MGVVNGGPRANMARQLQVTALAKTSGFLPTEEARNQPIRSVDKLAAPAASTQNDTGRLGPKKPIEADKRCMTNINVSSVPAVASQVVRESANGNLGQSADASASKPKMRNNPRVAPSQRQPSARPKASVPPPAEPIRRMTTRGLARTQTAIEEVCSPMY